MNLRSLLAPFSDPVTRAAAVELVPVGTAATSETVARELHPDAALAFLGDSGSGQVTRAQAMRVPSIRRGRALIAGTCGTLPLVGWRRAGDAVEPVARPLLSTLDPHTTPAYTITWTVDDLMFRGVSWWRVTARDHTDYPTAVARVAPDRVQVQLPTADRMGRVLVDGREVPDRDLIRFDGPDEGLLAYGGDTVRLALALMGGAKRTADNDVPVDKFSPREGAPELDDDQIAALLDSWHVARRDRSTAYVNGALDYETVGFNARDRQLTELAQLVASELARLLNLPASRIGAPQGSGMTYANLEADRRDLVDTTLQQYLTPIWQRLSMGDVTPHGQGVAFDLTAYLRGDTTSLVAAGVQAIGAKIASPAEVRTRWLGLPPRADAPDTITDREGPTP